MGKVTKRIITFTVLILIFGALAYPKVKPLFSSPSDANQSSSRSSSMLQVEAVQIEHESIEDRIFSSGTVQANEVVELSSESSGLITNIYFQEGREVNRGDLLVKINDSELQAQKQRATFRLNLAEQREGRQKRLLERGGISQDDYDATLNEVNVLRSELQLIDAQIAQTEVRAPFSGLIGLKYISSGSYITPGTRIASLQEVDPVKIDFSIPERFIPRVDVGDRINFTVQGVDSTFTGEVYAIEPRVDTQTRTLQIRAISGNRDQLLYPGAFANIVLILDQIDDAIMVPTISIVPELNAQKVYLVRNGKVVESRVRTGIRTSEKVQVVDGVAVGDTVLTTGLLQVRPGMDVEITDLKKATEL
ncbi:MAG: efflux RND transporter periplasmic adaptor subunit [Balneolaceae bacterium]|nr:MAG: efflux RND transporter periplasmic adaptor subunit [Balneolaceae bacterium]